MDSAALIEELNGAVVRSTASQRAEILHRITDLFALASANYSADQVELFDEILMRIATTIEVSARTMLAERPANNPRAPRKISRFLASHVAGPMLERSQQLDRYTLLESARNQQHLLAISRRDTLDEALTDVLVDAATTVVLSTAPATTN